MKKLMNVMPVIVIVMVLTVFMLTPTPLSVRLFCVGGVIAVFALAFIVTKKKA